MINLISKRMVHFFINQNAIKREDEEVYLYGIELMTSLSISIITTLIITLIFSQWYYFFIFFIFFLPLRMNAGGYHADSYGKCFLTTVSVYSAYIFLINNVSYISEYVAILILAFSIFVVFKYAPIIHANNIITESGIKSRKLTSRFLIIAYSLVILLLQLIGIDFKFTNAISFAIAAVTISITISLLLERREIK